MGLKGHSSRAAQRAIQEVADHRKNGISAKKPRNELLKEEAASTEVHRSGRFLVADLNPSQLLRFPKLRHRQLPLQKGVL